MSFPPPPPGPREVPATGLEGTTQPPGGVENVVCLFECIFTVFPPHLVTRTGFGWWGGG